MPSDYNLQTTNRFGFLDESENEENINVSAAKESSDKRQNKPAVKQQGEKKPVRDNERVEKKVERSNAPAQRGDFNRPPRQGGPTRPLNEERGGFGARTDDRTRAPRSNQGGFGGGFGNSGFAGRTPKHDSDRKSGSDKTGVKAFEKRDGAGAHNWGNIRDYPAEAEPTEKNDENEENKVEEKKEGDENAEVKPREPQEPPTMSIEDYFKNKSSQAAAKQVQLRKAGEGDGTFNVKLGEKVATEKATQEEVEVVYIKGGSGREKKKLDVVFGGQPRGDRGGGRGGRGRGGYQGGRGGRDGGGFNERGDSANMPRQQHYHAPREQVPSFDDSAFPTLGGN